MESISTLLDLPSVNWISIKIKEAKWVCGEKPFSSNVIKALSNSKPYILGSEYHVEMSFYIGRKFLLRFDHCNKQVSVCGSSVCILYNV